MNLAWLAMCPNELQCVQFLSLSKGIFLTMIISVSSPASGLLMRFVESPIDRLTTSWSSSMIHIQHPFFTGPRVAQSLWNGDRAVITLRHCSDCALHWKISLKKASWNTLLSYSLELPLWKPKDFIWIHIQTLRHWSKSKNECHALNGTTQPLCSSTLCHQTVSLILKKFNWKFRWKSNIHLQILSLLKF